MTAADIRAALDDTTLVSLQAMQRTLLSRLRTAPAIQLDAQQDIDDDYRAQLTAIDEEILQRTAKFAHNAGMPWTTLDDNRLKRLAGAGEAIEAIASTLGRTCAGVCQHAARFGYEFGNDGRATVASQAHCPAAPNCEETEWRDCSCVAAERDGSAIDATTIDSIHSAVLGSAGAAPAPHTVSGKDRDWPAQFPPIDGRSAEPSLEQRRDRDFVRQVAAVRGAL
jgi:hypothetical protein